MAKQPVPFDILKTFPGLIHRQPLFVTDRLDVDSYHLSFLDKHGQKINDDAQVPTFIEQLPDILSAINARQKALLSIPESWQHAIIEQHNPSLKLTFELTGGAQQQQADDSQFEFASHVNAQYTGQAQTLLIDIQQHSQASLSEHLPGWRSNHKVLCATNVHNQNDYDLCKLTTLDLLQGQFYTAPAISDRQKISPSQQVLTELLVQLQNPDIETEELAQTINQDISLSYKLLRLINSAFFGLPREVNSTQQAIVLLGQNKIKTWASLLCLSAVDNKPIELRVVAMTRARMCELLAKYYKGQPEIFFSVGMFSTLDALVDTPLDKLVDKLPLSPELVEALTLHTGAAGSVLRDVLNYERADWSALASSALPTEVMARTYLEAIHWAKELNAQMLS